MVKIRRVAALMAGVAILWLASTTQGPPVGAQTSKPLVGTYTVRDYTVNAIRSKAALKNFSDKPLHLLAIQNYVWVDYHAPYRASKDSLGVERIELDCLYYSGEFSGDGRLTFVFVDTKAGVVHRIVLEWGALTPPRTPPEFHPCGWKRTS